LQYQNLQTPASASPINELGIVHGRRIHRHSAIQRSFTQILIQAARLQYLPLLFRLFLRHRQLCSRRC
jgi:hypothetical protein